MITDGIGRHEVLLPMNYTHDTSSEQIEATVIQKDTRREEILHFDKEKLVNYCCYRNCNHNCDWWI